jgi:hypothetical protein
MADLLVHEPLSLEELDAETGMVLPERDLMQVAIGIGSVTGASVGNNFGLVVAAGIVLDGNDD